MVNIINSSFEIEQINAIEMIRRIERAGRTCYKSEDKITDESASGFVKMIIARGHESVLEHEKISVRIICDRGVSHEIVRHRLNAFSQESTRYCNYSKDSFGNEITVIIPPITDEQSIIIWKRAMREAEESYMALITQGVSPQIARSVLPNSLKTEIVWTCNLRQWRHVLKLRTSTAAHPQMREIMCPLLIEFKKLLPCVFEDIPEV
jgi:thymidylate synthase (FAD)